VSKTLVDQAGFKQVLFAMDAGQELSEHRAPYLALVQVLDGRLRMRVTGHDYVLEPASWLLMPPDAPHDVRAEQPTRFLLTLVKTVPRAAG
jgi:quercetin dioxygenase-like cupin family protein